MLSKVCNQQIHNTHKLIISMRWVLLLCNNIKIVKTTPKVHNRVMRLLLKSSVYTWVVPSHSFLTVGSNGYQLHAPTRFYDTQYMCTQVELYSLCLPFKLGYNNQILACNLDTFSAHINRQVNIQRTISMYIIDIHRVRPELVQDLVYCMEKISTNHMI